MSRLIFIVVIIAVVYFLLKSFRGRELGQGPEAGKPPAPAEDMVRCIYCGVHLPKSESIQSEGRYYCCEAHRRAHQAPPGGGNGE